ncbi:MAG: alpha/beta hydrolase [Chloroflexi bacterium]|nr:alpha/beta hydrolase [Chloroflexota bacterium]
MTVLSAGQQYRLCAEHDRQRRESERGVTSYDGLAITRSEPVLRRFRHDTGIRYGPHARNLLDVFEPEKQRSEAPLLVFFHGGGFRLGDGTRYAFVGEPFLDRGCRYVTVTYPLVPEQYYPDTAHDVELALGWVYRNLVAGSRAGMVVAGHSAGATAVAHAVFRKEWLQREGLPPEAISGVILAGGLFDFRDGPRIFVATDDRREEASILHRIETSPPAALVVCGEREVTPRIQSQSRELAALLTERGCRAEFFQLTGRDHFGAMDALLDDNTEPGRAALAMLNLA